MICRKQFRDFQLFVNRYRKARLSFEAWRIMENLVIAVGTEFQFGWQALQLFMFLPLPSLNGYSIAVFTIGNILRVLDWTLLSSEILFNEVNVSVLLLHTGFPIWRFLYTSFESLTFHEFIRDPLLDEFASSRVVSVSIWKFRTRIISLINEPIHNLME